MMPIVDGLEERYQDQMAFIRLNAADDGKETFRYYGLPGHPSYLLLNPSGDVLWSGFGSQSFAVLEMEFLIHLP